VSIGEVLAEARRQAGLSVTQVSRQTRIRESIVAAIEGDDYSACGGDFYARGHIRSIAGAVGADPEPLIQEYDAARRGTHALPDDVTEPIAPIRTRQRRRPAEPVTTVERRRRPRLPWAAALGVALLAGLDWPCTWLRAGGTPRLRPGQTGQATTTTPAKDQRHHQRPPRQRRHRR
jgi:cytoskeletal protein RodZ